MSEKKKSSLKRSVIVGVLLCLTMLTAAETGMIAGFCRDASSGEFLSYVNVYLEGGVGGAASNKQGYYVISDILPGAYTLVASMIGYGEQRVDINVKAGQKLRRDFILSRQTVNVEGVEITADRYRFEHEVDVGVQRIDFDQMRNIPGLVEQDLFRSLQMLPAVVSVSDFSSAMYIRGGTADQNLVLLDGVTVYNPYHLLGFYSTFILESVKGAELYTGGYPARYGGAISSVLDVDMKAGNSERFSAAGEIGLLTSRLVLEGPIPWGKGSWMVAGRRTYIDVITWSLDKIFKKAIEESDLESIYLPYHFYDLHAKVNWEATERSRFTVSGLFGDDVLAFHTKQASGSESDMDVIWGNGTMGGEWRYLFTPDLFSILRFNASRYRINVGLVETSMNDSTGEETEDSRLDLRSGIGELSTKWGLTWFTSPEHRIEFGVEGKGIEASNYVRTMMRLDEDEVLDTVWLDVKDTFFLASCYLEDRWEPTPFWVIETGLRGTYFSNGDYFRLEPRLGVKRRLTPDWALKFGAGIYNQYLYVPYPRDEESMKLPLQFNQQWLPADSNYPPLHSTMFILGSEYQLPNNLRILGLQIPDLSLSVEGYYKDIRNIRESRFQGGGIIIVDDADSNVFNMGRGYSYGGEVMLKQGSSWLGYSYSVTKFKFGEDDWFYPLHDSRHNLNFSFSLPLGKGWGFNTAWIFSSGLPYTAQIGWYQAVNWYGEPYWEPITGARSNVRYPAYHRLDVGFTKDFKICKKIDAEFYFQVLNAYWRKNVLFYDYDVDSTGTTRRSPVYSIPIPLPSFGIRGRF
ncbi:TonB-dependent receptor [candidate division WOR-3 bacterium]|nr:TonB-dependent receptor [candidate division WOR-3 bacterium]